MKKRKLIIVPFVLFVFCGFLSHKAAAQVDPHFSQYYAYPMWLNPGLTGVINGEYRITANFKRQWATIANPYQTEALSFDTYPSHHFAYGVTVLNQSAGDGGWNYLNALASFAYRLILDEDKMNVISIGVQGGVINRHFDRSKLEWGNQWNPVTGYDPTIPSGEHFDQTSATDLDVNFGIVYFNRNPNHTANPFVGLSVYHLTRPDDPFYKSSKGRLPMRFNAHGGLRIKLSRRFNLTPQIIYMQQGEDYGSGSAEELVGSLYTQYMLSQNSDLLFGFSYRNEDAFIPFLGFHLGDFTLGVSYDVNISDLDVASAHQGGIELSLSYSKRNNNNKNMATPRFVCPRL